MSKTISKNVLHFSHDNRVLGSFYGTDNGPTVVIFSGIHGNEKAGVHAAQLVIDKIKRDNVRFIGNLHIILGNINALNKGIRFEDKDLNRVWRNSDIDNLRNETTHKNLESREQKDIFLIIQEILKEPGPFYFLDLHTTSASSVPFITISDSLNNRKFSANFPIPVVLGIEEYLDGPLLTFINEYGHIALGFEGGAHHDESSIVSSEAFIWKALVHSKCVAASNIPGYLHYENVLKNLGCEYQFFEIKYRYQVSEKEHFEMLKGFENFEPISKNQTLALSDGVEIYAPDGGRIFMPLYQKLGEDGFFILNKISRFWLGASLTLRKLKINHVLRLIPGVKKDPDNNYTLIVDPRIARFMTKQIFHLFGYRQQILKDDKLHYIKRDRKLTEL
ncbi:succinylglutamate desuccinylase/aspartoacylase family protein [Lutimonas halocynthiae]|uniref:succinylglutamate desuccinylase/aspartoacylase family protein n=1 Tax=Lutimonas halocynthiae TaxID=1446477 RepID=UPI0025B467FC|nr:succinylglutamate desuccinylase/aspartoacylase family protein [Lutimonas halocynthiae]MDN3644192.1 succinylglutamate desuccinylase/aspartoacylase family protein [Lutimonas halocynthiae]